MKNKSWKDEFKGSQRKMKTHRKRRRIKGKLDYSKKEQQKDEKGDITVLKQTIKDIDGCSLPQ